MAYKARPTTQGPGHHPDYVLIHKQIKGKLHPLRLKAQRFEKTMDQIDKAVDKGASHADIVKNFAGHMHTGAVVPEPEPKLEKFSAVTAPVIPAKPSAKAAPHAGSKADLVHSIAAGMSASSASQIAKAVHARHPEISYANAYYLANKLFKNKR